MSDLIHTPSPDDPPRLSPAAVPGLAIDRRRPGRVEEVNPNLIALLRNPAAGEPLAPDDAQAKAILTPEEEYEADNLSAARGIAVALLIVTPFWAAIAALWWALSHQ